jgi:ABC-type Mn2+/Zn2+ transport system permease subunit
MRMDARPAPREPSIFKCFHLLRQVRTLQQALKPQLLVGAVPVFMIARFLTSNWFAALVLLVAAASLVLLYESGKTTEAILGAAILFLALVLILIGSRKGDRDR